MAFELPYLASCVLTHHQVVVNFVQVCNPRFLVYYMPKAPVGQSGYQLVCIVTILHAVRGEPRLVVLCCVESQCVHRESKLIGTPDLGNPVLLY